MPASCVLRFSPYCGERNGANTLPQVFPKLDCSTAMATVGNVNDYHSQNLFRTFSVDERVDRAQGHDDRPGLTAVAPQPSEPAPIQAQRRASLPDLRDCAGRHDGLVKLVLCDTARSESGFFDGSLLGSRRASNDSLGTAGMGRAQGLSDVAATPAQAVPKAEAERGEEEQAAPRQLDAARTLPAPTVMPATLVDAVAQIREAVAQVKAVTVTLPNGAQFDNLEFVDKANLDALEAAFRDRGIRFLYHIRGESNNLKETIAQYADIGKRFAAEAQTYATAVEECGGDIKQLTDVTNNFKERCDVFGDDFDKVRENLPKELKTGWWPAGVSFVCTVAAALVTLPFIAEVATAGTMVGLLACACMVIGAAGMAAWDLLEKLIGIFNETVVLSDGTVNQSTENSRNFVGNIVGTIAAETRHQAILAKTDEIITKTIAAERRHQAVLAKTDDIITKTNVAAESRHQAVVAAENRHQAVLTKTDAVKNEVDAVRTGVDAVKNEVVIKADETKAAVIQKLEDSNKETADKINALGVKLEKLGDQVASLAGATAALTQFLNEHKLFSAGIDRHASPDLSPPPVQASASSQAMEPAILV